MAKANSAAIIVEALAEKEANGSDDPPESQRIVTDGAIFDDGKVTLQGNPLATMKEIRCPKCNLPRLLYPTDGNGGRKPDASIKHCTRHPFIDKWDHDIYGQRFPTDAVGPGRGRKKKDVLQGKAQAETGTGTSSFDSPAPSPPPAEEKTKAPSFPSSKCHVCGRFLIIRRFASHLEKCMGIKGRASGRAAALKINGNGNTGTSTPAPSLQPGSRKGTPALSQNKKPSPVKRDRDRDEYDFEDDESSDEPMKKKRKRMLAKDLKKSVPAKPIGKLNVNGQLPKKWKSGRMDVPRSASASMLGNGTKSKPVATDRRGSDSSGTLSSP
jgi:hypothetical protein